ncbi:hypothetical protein ABW20_dc0110410 [Dactylellina cionopaga]|nr:hypothetical protein ABW20_dc0110410 [Dactylellina cionopaga]
MRSTLSTASVLLASVQLLGLIPAALCELKIDLKKPDTLRDAAKTVMKSLAEDYSSQDPLTAGLLPSKYSFFESGLFFNTIINYAAYTGDTTYNSLFMKDFYNQVGNNDDFMPANSSAKMANDDVGYWALAAMSAAEFGAKPADSNAPSYLTLADNVFNDFVGRWDTTTCKGGLRWSIFAMADGYDFKDSNSNGVFFELAARLGAQTGNKTYLDWANKVYDWSNKTGLIGNEETNSWGQVFAGASVQDNCQQLDKTFYSAQQANYIYGSALMYNTTNSKTWLNRATLFTSFAAVTYFGPQAYVDDGTSQIVIEQACEYQNKCNTDQKAGKSVLFRSLAAAMTYDNTNTISQLLTTQLKNSIGAAAKSCNSDGKCGFKWEDMEYDASKGTGVGEKMAAIEAFLTMARQIDPLPNTAAFASNNNDESPSSTQPAGASQTSSTPSGTTKPNSGSRLVAEGLMGAIAVACFLQMLL